MSWVSMLFPTWCHEWVQVEREGPFGEGITTEDLLPGGGDVAVTAANRAQFVELYVQHLLEKSVQPQFAAFRKGFDQVPPSRRNVNGDKTYPESAVCALTLFWLCTST